MASCMTATLVIMLTETSVVGVGAADGKLVWEVPFEAKGMGSYNSITPVVDGQTVIVAREGTGTTALKVEKTGDAAFRCSVEGQHDERGRNRQASWYFFRMDHVLGRDISLTLTDLVGEYNDRPGACPFSADIIPVFSYDAEHWEHFDATEWDDVKKEATLKFHPNHDTIWIAHIQPYTHSRLLHLLAEIKRNNFHMTNVARALGLERSHLYKKCQQLGIDLQTLRKPE